MFKGGVIMKRKLISVLLSISMCLTMISPAGAASFGSAEETDTAVMDAGAEVEFDAGSTQTEEENGASDIFSAGEEENPDASLEEEFQDEAVPDEQEKPEEFLPGVTEEEVPDAETGDTILADAEDWEKDGEHFKLRKTAVSVQKNAAEPAKEENTAEDIVTETAENAEAAFTSEEEGAAAEASQAEEGETDPQTEIPETEPTPEPEAEEKPQTDDDAQTEELPPAETTSGYYTEADGILCISTEYKNTVHKGYYLFDENGYLVTGKREIQKGTFGQSADTEFWFRDAANAEVYPEFEGEEMNPCSSNLGQQIKDDWAWTGSTFRFCDANGKYMTVSQLDEIYKQTGKYTGYYKIGNDYYCLKEDGTPRTGEITLKVGSSSAKYYFQPAAQGEIPGRMYYHGWFTHKTTKGDRWVYYNKGVTNPKDIGKALERGIIATRLDIDKMGNYTYLIDSNGYIIKSTMKKAANGAYYCTDSRGVIYRDRLVKYKDYRYYFNADGKRATWKNMWHVCKGAGNRYYYFGSSAGRVQEKKGWQKIPNSKGKFAGWFYFPSSGNHYINKLTSSGYYFTSKGKLAGGIQEINGKKYLFAVSDEKTHRGKMYKSTLVRYRNRWYYAEANGVLKESGWKKINGNYYYFDDCKAVTKKFIKKNGVNGYLDANGKFTQGWVIVSNAKNQVKYINPDGDDFVKNGSKWIDGLLYYFDKNGYRINDLTNIYKQPYYYTVDRVNGVMTVYNAAKTVPVKSIRVSVGLPGTPTPLGGPYNLTPYGRWQALMGPSWGQYGTHVDGAGQGGIFVHSVACAQANHYNLPGTEYNKLGSPASHGCIRACVADAKWVYEHSRGGKLYVFDGKANSNEAMKGPLGRRALVPLKYPYNFDPTDPAI